MPLENFQQEDQNPQAINNSGSDSVPDMDSYVSSDVNEEEIDAQIMRIDSVRESKEA